MSLYDRLDFNLLKSAWSSVYAGKNKYQKRSSRGIDDVSISEFSIDADKNINLILQRLKDKSYKFCPLRAFKVPKSNGKDDRLICAPTISDRIVQKAILAILKPTINPLINTKVSYCGVHKSEGEALNQKYAIVNLVKQIRNKRYYVFETDIKGFYDNINKKNLYENLCNLLKDDSLNDLLKQVIFFKIGNPEIFTIKKNIAKPHMDFGIPQGSPLSPFFSNIYLRDFDLKMYEKCGMQLIRYVDDYIILGESKSEVDDYGKLSMQLLNELKLETAPDKTFTKNIKHENLKFLGLSITKCKIQPKVSCKKMINDLTQNDLNYNTYRHMHISQSKIIEIMNLKISGKAQYYKYYHISEYFEKINICIQNLRKRSRLLQDLKEIDISMSKPIIKQELWQNLFD